MIFGIFGKNQQDTEEEQQLKALRPSAPADGSAGQSSKLDAERNDSGQARTEDLALLHAIEQEASRGAELVTEVPLAPRASDASAPQVSTPGENHFPHHNAIEEKLSDIAIKAHTPAPAPKPIPAVPQSSPQAAKRIYTILVADDEPDTRTLMQAMLSDANYKILQAADGLDALLMWKEHQPDLVILDVQMPGRSGLDVCKIIKNDTPERYTPVFLVTCLDDPYSKIEGLKQGADDYITKPFFTEELQIKVASFLRIKNLTEDLARARDELAEQERRLTMKLYELGKL